ncbi:MAG: 1,4-dihydroxy-2-naphthoate polyprenyltransferase [Bacteroidia bacterium]|nr:1,4-dihydroxy-2-naphthoate polyprenyltransferase [Bacteroidia bacterium]MCZ2278368.1 1,4-dihydroxy-2-naphthoate polyprenyltransferase [Bacteroidia bacterium]
MASVSAWLVSFRLRTLPLALSVIITGSFLAAYRNNFRWNVFILAITTTLFLQILSNLANDYGDTVSGVDNKERIGPQRSLQAGSISLSQMKTAIMLFVILSLISGVRLIIVAMSGLKISYSLLFLTLGIAAIIAALKYTIGRNPYGYTGFGDLFVFIFFGIVGVMGSYFLYTHQLTGIEFMPAVTMGCFSTGVLNLNNLRDIENDSALGKQTLAVKIGVTNAKIYHALLLTTGMLTAVIYTFFAEASVTKWIYLIAFIGIIRSIVVVMKNTTPHELDPELKKLAITTLLFSLLFGAGLIL